MPVRFRRCFPSFINYEVRICLELIAAHYGGIVALKKAACPLEEALYFGSAIKLAITFCSWVRYGWRLRGRRVFAPRPRVGFVSEYCFYGDGRT